MRPALRICATLTGLHIAIYDYVVFVLSYTMLHAMWLILIPILTLICHPFNTHPHRSCRRFFEWLRVGNPV